MANDFTPLGVPGNKNDHDREDVDHRVILFTASLIVIMAVIAHLSLYFLLAGFRRSPGNDWVQSPPGSPRVTGDTAPPAPRLQAQPEDERNAERAEADHLLNGYGWSDPAHTHLRVPIEEAKRLLLRRGSVGAWNESKGGGIDRTNAENR